MCVYYTCSVRDAVKDNVPVVDVDGLFLVLKHEQLRREGVNVGPLQPPSIPFCGWITTNEANYKDKSAQISHVLPGIATCAYVNLPANISHSSLLH